jgi:hypothetical protein
LPPPHNSPRMNHAFFLRAHYAMALMDKESTLYRSSKWMMKTRCLEWVKLYELVNNNVFWLLFLWVTMASRMMSSLFWSKVCSVFQILRKVGEKRTKIPP